MKAIEAREQSVINKARENKTRRQSMDAMERQKKRNQARWAKSAIEVDLPKVLEAIQRSVKNGEFNTNSCIRYESNQETAARARAVYDALKKLGYNVISFHTVTAQEDMGDSAAPCVIDVHRARLNISW